jgi:hypothetical protein
MHKIALKVGHAESMMHASHDCRLLSSLNPTGSRPDKPDFPKREPLDEAIDAIFGAAARISAALKTQ